MTARQTALFSLLVPGLLAWSSASGERLALVHVRDKAEVREAAEAVLGTLAEVAPRVHEDLQASLTAVGEGSQNRFPKHVAVQRAFDSACLLEVAINPESRVKVTQGPAVPRLESGRWSAFLVKVVNEAGVTAPLRVSSPQAMTHEVGPTPSQWLRIGVQSSEHQPPELTGRRLEYRVVRLKTEDVGFRSAVVAMDVGQGTADIGFRNDVLLTFRCRANNQRTDPTTSERLLERLPPTADEVEARLVGQVTDADSGRTIAARVYITSDDGAAYTVESLGGNAVPYRREPHHLPNSSEVHTALSAYPFVATLPAGGYEVCVERGKEYLPLRRRVEIADGDQAIVLRLQRLTDMAASGWYSGDAHVHRPIDELPTAMLADDLNVALPVTAWVSDTRQSPAAAASNREPPRVQTVDATHLIGTANTEYEITRVEGRDRILGSLLVLNHRSPLVAPASSLDRLAREVRQQGGLIDMDKHAWPWSLIIAPTMDADLYELANNHLWRTEFGFERFAADTVADYMRLDRSAAALSEQGWIHFGFETYYALLNCGLDLRVSAGSASGVHPTPLGFCRAYVQVDGELSVDKWIDVLSAGRSFVTTGPLLMAKLGGSAPGGLTELAGEGVLNTLLRGEVYSEHPVKPIEVVKNGAVVLQLPVQNRALPSGGYHGTFEANVPIDGVSWIAARVFEDRPDGRPRFAHTSPWHFRSPGQRLRPSADQVAYLTRTVRRAIAEHGDALSPENLEQFRQALSFYEGFSVRSADARQ